MSTYDDAVNKRKAQTAANTTSDTSLTDWAKDGWGFINRGINLVTSKVGDQIEKVAPSDPEERLQKEVTDKISRDEIIDKASHAGKALGNKINQVGGSAVFAGVSFLKGALGAVSNEAKARLAEIDGETPPSQSETHNEPTDNNNTID